MTTISAYENTHRFDNMPIPENRLFHAELGRQRNLSIVNINTRAN